MFEILQVGCAAVVRDPSPFKISIEMDRLCSETWKDDVNVLYAKDVGE